MRLFRTPDFRRLFLERHKNSRILDLGCGGKKTPGAIGADLSWCRAVDIICDLDSGSFPFKSGMFDAVTLHHVVEHLDQIPRVLKEVHRLLRGGGEVFLVTPHFTDRDSWTDTTHRHHLGIESFMQFCGRPNSWFDLELAYVSLKKPWKGLGYEYLINRGGGKNRISRSALRWEKYYCYTRRGGEMCFILRKTADDQEKRNGDVRHKESP